MESERPEECSEVGTDPFAFVGIGANPDVQAERADELLAEGFGE
jgi:hypothetical protein